MKLKFSFLLVLISFLSCENQNSKVQQVTSNIDTTEVKHSNDSLSEDSISDDIVPMNLSEQTYDISYFSGKAEIATYALKKARYEDTYQGEAVLIFVSEPFLKDKQVKADRPTSKNSIKVLKMNRIDRFSTGIYDYSQFTSVFTPIEKFEANYPLKMTFGNQDWCGQSFTQINNNQGFDYLHKSYFESDGDTSYQIDYAMTEDNMFNLVRLSLDLLPIGEFNVLPSMSYLRNSHSEMKTYQALGSLDTIQRGFLYVYEIPELRRSVRFFISSENQNRITSWEESYPTIFDNMMRTSTYELKGIEVLPYWELNKKENEGLRKDLKLMY